MALSMEHIYGGGESCFYLPFIHRPKHFRCTSPRPNHRIEAFWGRPMHLEVADFVADLGVLIYAFGAFLDSY